MGARRFKKRSGWEKLDRGPPTYRHVESGWVAMHCGHPTAIFPYCCVRPEDGLTIVAMNGHGFQTLNLAMQAVESVLDGTMEVSVRPELGAPRIIGRAFDAATATGMYDGL